MADSLGGRVSVSALATAFAQLNSRMALLVEDSTFFSSGFFHFQVVKLLPFLPSVPPTNRLIVPTSEDTS